MIKFIQFNLKILIVQDHHLNINLLIVYFIYFINFHQTNFIISLHIILINYREYLIHCHGLPIHLLLLNFNNFPFKNK